MDNKDFELALFIKCALEAGAKIIKGDAGLSPGIWIGNKPINTKELFEILFSPENCQDK